jgi:hypothetical protein
MTILDFMEYTNADRDMVHSWQVKQLLNRTGHKFNPSESEWWGVVESGGVRIIMLVTSDIDRYDKIRYDVI